MTVCPTCGQSVVVRDIERATALLRDGERDLYLGQDGHWYITQGGGEVAASLVTEMLSRGLIRDKYSNLPNGCYTTGRTIDWDATMEWRKGRKRKEWKTIHMDGTVSRRES